MIRSGKPFMVARFGNTELSVMTSVLKRRLFGSTPEIEERFDDWFYSLGELRGKRMNALKHGLKHWNICTEKL